MPFITHSGSKQFIVSPGQRFAVDNLRDKNPGETIEMPLLLAFGAEKGISKLEVKVVGHAKGAKIRVVKFKSKSNYHKQYGFRPYQTVLEVISGNAPTKTPKVEEKAVEPKKKVVAKKPATKTVKSKKEVVK